MKTRGLWVGLGLGIGMAILVAAGGLILNRIVPGVDSQLASLNPKMFVMITQPSNGQSYPTWTQVSILVDVVSQDPLQKVEAFVDGVPLPMAGSLPPCIR